MKGAIRNKTSNTIKTAREIERQIARRNLRLNIFIVIMSLVLGIPFYIALESGGIF